MKIFQPVEKTFDLVVTDFKFEQLNRSKPKVECSPNGTSREAENGHYSRSARLSTFKYEI